jgi:hypothetical protein
MHRLNKMAMARLLLLSELAKSGKEQLENYHQSSHQNS